ncbi:hypothetical protein H5410_062830 [Solanum commersonii]|uniref:Uncharacterized protein n=1 Tax=Solanum commersonii TaxID=4109 RepID=A0A9J5WDH2_SOLCO|nr:hypothetical protein H5410_062830 [Solanum commersonii]
MTHISDIKLIRTDTTLDLSQKAEKGILYFTYEPGALSSFSTLYFSFYIDTGQMNLKCHPLLISCESMTHISDIKLIRTDTTLDLSQKAEKGMLYLAHGLRVFSSLSILCLLYYIDMGLMNS